MSTIASLIDWNQPTLYYALGNILFNPVFWNIAARAGTARWGERASRLLWSCPDYFQFGHLQGFPVSSFLRDDEDASVQVLSRFLSNSTDNTSNQNALENQPTSPVLEYGEVKVLAALLFVTGNTLVLSSMWALGVTGTYLGDYFGILMKERVTSFPFNVTDNPMYYGSSLTFLATALWYASPAGIFLTAIVFVFYLVALRFEGPFTAMIYAKRDEELSKNTAKKHL
ncbi:LOW QUALITY PROTEIN: phospholipid methyltransferase-domain-containing protein [Jimgerdemannia flammicorona]|uniref:Phosphatidyl-N-methylethanolamine N-methyltransferase n=1 Tax=Jimgerdemannia flammicorona TaxID=994334 RepID=A0A433DAP8_9FUNG|nr:LOW QUALITY PROTEIN: phospholipid methyltransferase-domain-containing protein [Jimgerdemannia flammicorona]